MKTQHIIVLLLLSVPVLSWAPPSMPEAPGIPIDGGLSFLMAGGALYGAKKVRDRYNKE